MTTTTSTSTSTVIAAAQPMFTGPERQALAGFLAGYTGLTREAYALDLRQYASWCQQHNLPLFQARPPRPRFPRPTPNVKTSPALTSQTVMGVALLQGLAELEGCGLTGHDGGHLLLFRIGAGRCRWAR